MFCCVACRVSASDEESTQTLVFSVSATFVFKNNQELKGYTPPPPPGLLTVPYDVFYPFVGSSGAAPAQHGLIVAHAAFGFSLFCLTYFF
jgi:hypothetical protein